MVTSTTIRSSVATWNTSGLSVTSLVENTGTLGYTRFVINNRLSGGAWVYVNALNKCIIYTLNNYITSLYDIVNVTGAVGKVDLALIMSFPCTTGSDCSTACSIYSTSEASRNENISIGYALGITPNPVSNITLTPGNGSITVNWTAPNNAPIFAYGISLYQGAIKLTGGYKQSFPFTINNLQNGVSYTVYVQPVSDDYLFGTIINASAVPVAPCTNPVCTIQVT